MSYKLIAVQNTFSIRKTQILNSSLERSFSFKLEKIYYISFDRAIFIEVIEDLPKAES